MGHITIRMMALPFCFYLVECGGGDEIPSGADTDNGGDSDADAGAGGWEMSIIGSYDRFYEIKIGDGRNDGTNRLYSATYDGSLLEWTFETESAPWRMRRCGGVTDDVSDSKKRMISIWVGPGRNDGVKRVYAADVNGDNYEFSYDAAADEWEMETIGRGNFQTGIVVGDARNDGVARVISCGLETTVDELSWDGQGWQQAAISDEARDIWPPCLASARNDGYNRLYCPDWSLPYLREYSWNGASWTERAIQTSKNLVKAVAGDGRNDGIQRVYASQMYGHINEFSYAGDDEWNQVDLMEGQGEDLSRYGLCFGRTRQDNVNRLYSVAQGGKLTEHTYTGDGWVNADIDAISGATADLTVGQARNDGIDRVYVAGSNGNLYEYTHSDFAGSR